MSELSKNTKESLSPKAAQPTYFSISLPKLALFSIFTLGIYDVYWFYRNWKAVKVAEGSKIRPFWRAVFTVFFVFPLFKKIVASAERHGYKKQWYTDRLAGIYALLLIAANLIGRIPESLAVNIAFFAIIFIGVVPLLLMQKVADFSNSKLPSGQTNKGSAWQIAIIAIGIIFLALTMIGMFVPAEETGLTSDQQAKKAKMDSLTVQYEKCSSDLATREKNVDTTDHAAVDTYNADWEKCEALRLEQNKAVDTYNASIGQ